MSLRFMPEITDGILLSRNGHVHRDTGRRTPCGETVIASRAATVSHVQALVHKLPLCPACYPAHHANGGRHAR